MPLSTIIIVAAIVVAPVYYFVVMKRIKSKTENATPEELDAMRKKSAQVYKDYFVLEENEELEMTMTGPLYRGDQIPQEELAPFVTDDVIADDTVYFALTNKGRFLGVTKTLGSAVSDNLNTWEMPESTQIIRGETLFPGGKNSKKVSPAYPPLDLYIIRTSEKSQFGFWVTGSEGEAFSQKLQKIAAGIS